MQPAVLDPPCPDAPISAEPCEAVKQGVYPVVPPAMALPSRRRLMHRRTLSWIVSFADGLALTFVLLAVAAIHQIDLLASSVSVVVPLVMIPLAGWWGVYALKGRVFRYSGSLSGHLVRVASGALLGMAFPVAFCFATGTTPSGAATNIAGVSLVLMLALHANYIGVARTLTRAGRLSDNVVIIGATPAAQSLVKRNAKKREVHILGYFDDRVSTRGEAGLSDVPFLGGIDDLLEWKDLPQVDRIIITVTSTAQGRVRGLIDRLRTLPQEVILMLDLEGFNPEQTSLAEIAEAPAAYVSGAPRDYRRAFAKRIFDLILGSVLLVAFTPVALVIAALIRLDSSGPIFFRQKRHGFNNETIRVWKFRTMRPDQAAEEGIIHQTVHNDPRITRIGGFLRRTSLDEIPQLLNVLSGEMSLVGPRPHAVGMTAGSLQVSRIVGDYAHRHRMKPGITGWAQVNGSRGPVHTHEEVEERVRLDQSYIKRSSLLFDLYILVITAPRLLGDRKKAR